MFELHPQLALDCIVLGDFPLCRLLLSRDSNYPWFILVPRRPALSEIYQLSVAERDLLMAESSCLSELLMEVLQGDKLNVAALGNMVPQLHIHHIVRYERDAAWPRPVWGAVPPRPYADAELGRLRDTLLPLLREKGLRDCQH
ncbi:MAG: HIT domain-containing protein [Porticoccaceae bacterium]|nr:HIT domain-containing protein [Porticoccaceae bacterium]